MRLLLAEMRKEDGDLLTSGDVYITIIDITDITDTSTVLTRRTRGVYHVGSGIWAYENPYETPGTSIYLVVFDYSDGVDYNYYVTGVIFDDTAGDWDIITAGVMTVGHIKSDNDSIDITMRNGKLIRLDRQ